ncbi:TPA: ATP-grasp domain-containing protein [Streptococcus suis]
MVVYIREGKFLEETSMNKFNAQVGYHLRGEEVRLFKETSEIKRLYKEDILIDYIYETRWFLEKMGIEVPEVDYPQELSSFYGRWIRDGKLGEIVHHPENWGVFIKPKIGSKKFTGRVVQSTSDLIGIGLPFDYPIWISQTVDFKREWRVFVLEGQVLDVRPYIGDYHYHYDASIIDQAIACWQSAPVAYAMDIGVTEDGRTLIVEINDGYALGNYGLNPLKAAIFFERRWRELTKPYFTTHEFLDLSK